VAPPPPPPVEAYAPENANAWYAGWFYNDRNPLAQGTCPSDWVKDDQDVFRPDPEGDQEESEEEGTSEVQDQPTGKGKRGRKPGSKNKPKDPQPTTLEAAAAAVGQLMPAMAASAAVAAGVQRTAGRPIGTLFVKCLPVSNNQPVDFHEISREALKFLAANGMVGHYKCQEFGRGVGLYAAAVEQIIQGNGGRDVFLDLASAEACDAFAVLVSNADTVIRGL
jgi:hypothetical protein